MSDTNPIPTQREEIEMLLPWYVAGTLDEDDHALVSAYLERHPEMAAQIELVRQEQAEVIGANEAIVVPVARSFDAMMADIANDARAPNQLFMSGLFDRISEFFSTPRAGAVRWAAAAAAALIMVQAIAITALVVRNDPSKTYQSATGGNGQSLAIGTFALVQFSDTAQAADISSTLSKLELVIVDGPRPGGLYKVRLDKTKISEAARDNRIAELRARPDVFTLVTPSN